MNELVGKTIAVTGLSAGESPSPGLPMIRSIKEHPAWNGRIVGLGYNAMESGIFDRKMLDSAYLLPIPTEGRQVLLDRIRSIHSREPLTAILPSLDVELPNFVGIADELWKMGIRTFLPTEPQLKRREKINLQKFGRDARIPTPETLVLGGPPGKELQNIEYPVVVKGAFYDAVVAYTQAAAIDAVYRIASYWGYPILIQKFVPGEEYNVVAVGDGTGETVGAICMKKLVMTEKKKGWVCVSIENEKLLNLVRTAVSELKWRGPMEIEAILSSEDGEFYMFEINPRFPQWIYLAQAAGSNLPYVYLELALGEKPNPGSYRPGVVFSNYTTNLITDLNTISGLFTNGELHYEKKL